MTRGEIVRLSGNVDRDEARALDGVMRDVAIGPAPVVVVDISAVEEVNGALLGVLVRATRWVSWRNGRMVIVCRSDELRRGLEVAGLDHDAEVRTAWPDVSSEPRARSRSGTPARP